LLSLPEISLNLCVCEVFGRQVGQHLMAEHIRTTISALIAAMRVAGDPKGDHV
jgi:hypothetical protein